MSDLELEFTYKILRLQRMLEERKMLEILEFVEKNVLPQLLISQPSKFWQSLYIDYERPIVERVWCQFGPIRINLHKIHPCGEGEALFHPHPWPSAMHVVSGVYETAVGSSIWNEEPEFAIKGVVSGDFKYEMISENSWHYVRPIDIPAYTVMITGKPWVIGKWRENRIEKLAKKNEKKMRELTDEEKNEILHFFADVFVSENTKPET